MAGITEAKLERSVGTVKKARRKAGDAPTRKTTGKASLKKGAGAGARKVAETSKKAKQEETAGDECLCVEANKAVDQNKENLARHLLSETLHGDARSARLLLSIAEPTTGQTDEEQERPHQSLALLLESEPEWHGEHSEADLETGGGSLEPEG